MNTNTNIAIPVVDSTGTTVHTLEMSKAKADSFEAGELVMVTELAGAQARYDATGKRFVLDAPSVAAPAKLTRDDERIIKTLGLDRNKFIATRAAGEAQRAADLAEANREPDVEIEAPIRKATLTAEDRRYCRDLGLDPAAFAIVKAGLLPQGAA